jgi:hypothetical protein
MSPSFASARLFSFILATLVVASAHATITINSVDESRVSNVRGLGTADVTIFGGIAGTCAKNAAASDTTCTSCVQTAGGDSGLTPCNDRRINGSLILRITITSDTQASGYPTMVVTPTSGTAVKITPVTTPGAVSKGSPGTIEVRWSDICNQMTVGTSGGSASNCALTGSDYALATVTVGMKSVNDSNGFAAEDDTAAIKIKLVAGPADTTQYLATTGGNGITYFEVVSGDQKGTLNKLSCTPGSGFPNSQNIRFQWVRVLFEERTNESTSAWSLINPGSPHTDLQISDSGSCDQGNLDLSPIAFQGGTATDSSGNQSTVNIENASASTKPIYDIKVAVVDEARNVYLYTPSANDQDCQDAAGNPNNPDARNQDGTFYECHTIRPAEVAGVLANKTNCFIATASYGSPMAGEVDTFRHFRDAYLIPTKLGFQFVRWYYEHGPVYAKFIAQSDTYRAIARGALWLPLQFAKLSLDYGIVAGLSFLASITLAPLALLAWALKALKRKRKASAHA